MRLSKLLVVACGVVWCLAAGAAAAAPQVLPASLRPTHYELSLAPDTEHLTFRGQVAVTGQVAKAGRRIVLNAKGLTLDEVRLDGRKASAVALDDKLGRATLSFGKPFAAGRHVLSIAYHGPISTGTLGFFAMDYDSPAGKRRTLATNLEPTSARQLLPCWDEPAMKATFTVTVDAPADRMALSNMPAASKAPLPGGLQRTRFAQTPKMSTYLLFIGVGDYERVHRQVDGVDVGVVVKRGDTGKADYALSQASALLHYYNDYFGVRFPLPKLDLIAAPGAIQGGSMENWGAIFYSQDHVLFDPHASTERERQRVFLVVSHEMAHQWFGDLVTMAWWDNLWLNEGFARWMQTHAADALHPEWNTGLQAADVFEQGKRADAKVSTHPVLQPVSSAEQAILAFDEITYDKGAAVITMLESYVGPERFREGVRRYMRAHAYGNTVDGDLWGQVQAAAGKPVLAIEHDFTRRSGVPLVKVTPTSGAGVMLEEGQFAEDPESLAGAPRLTWRLPLTVASPGRAPTSLLLTDHASVDGPAPLVNAGGLAYARVAYEPSGAAALAARLGQLSGIDQINLMNDAWALGQSGYAPASNVLTFISRLPASADPVVWGRAIDLLRSIDRAYGEAPARAAFRKQALALLAPIAGHVETPAKPGEPANLTSLRSSVWTVQARFGDTGAIARARSVYASGQGSVAEQRAALDIVAEAADPATFDGLLARVRQTQDPQEKGRLLAAMARVSDPALAARMVEVVLGPDAPAGSAAGLIGEAGMRNSDSVWAALKPHLSQKLPMDDEDAWRVIPGVAAGSAEPGRVAEIRDYGEKHVPADARRPVESAVSSIKLNQRVRTNALPDIDRWVAAHPAG